MMGKNGPRVGLARGDFERNPGGSVWDRIFCKVCQWRSYSRQASRLLISPVRTRRRISTQCSMLVYTPGLLPFGGETSLTIFQHKQAEAQLERYTSRSARRTPAGAALLDRRLHH